MWCEAIVSNEDRQFEAKVHLNGTSSPKRGEKRPLEEVTAVAEEEVSVAAAVEDVAVAAALESTAVTDDVMDDSQTW